MEIGPTKEFLASFREVKGFKELPLALAAILGIGGVVAGVLALHQVSVFPMMGHLGTRISLYGGGGAALLAGILRGTLYFTAPTLPPPPIAPETLPPPKDEKVEAPPPRKDEGAKMLEGLELSWIDVHHDFPPPASVKVDGLEEFFIETQTDFIRGCTEYLRKEDLGGKAHLEGLRAERDRNLANGKPPKVTIVGGGPSGLIAALEAYLAGADVLLVEKRMVYARQTMLRLDTETERYLKRRLGHLYVIADELIKDRSQGHFEREFFGSDGFITTETKILEWLLNLIIEELAKEDQAGITIYRGWEFIGIEEETTVVLSRNGEEMKVPSEWIVGADGASSRVRQAASIEWTSISAKRPSVVVTFANPWANDTHFRELELTPAAVTVAFDQLERNDSSQELATAHKYLRQTMQPYYSVTDEFARERSRMMTPKVFEKEKELVSAAVVWLNGELKAQGWKEERMPSNRLFTSMHTVYLGTDLPADLLGADENRLLDWIGTSLKQNIPDAAFTALRSQVRTLTAFEAQLFRAQTVHKQGVFLIGDATATPDFQTGSGAKKAIEDARAFGELVKARGGSKDFEKSMNSYIEGATKRIETLHQKAFDMGFAFK